MHLIIKGSKWGVIFCPLKEIPTKEDETFLGLCDYDNKTIFIADTTKGEERLATILHEILHASDDKLTEKKVQALSSEAARALWRMGYRRIEQ